MPMFRSSLRDIPGPARSFTGARRFASAAFAALLVGAALLAAAPGARAEEDRPEGPPPWRLGGRMGFTVDAAAFPESTGMALEVYVRVPPATIAQLVRDPEGAAHVRAAFRLRGHGKPLESAQEFVLSAADTARGQGKVLLARFPVGPGAWRLDVKLDDLLSHKRGIVYGGRNESGELQGDVQVPRPQAGRDLSDLEFAWPVAEPTHPPGLAFVRGGLAVVPNPERLYGLFANELAVAFTARGKPADERAWQWVARVYDDSGRVVAEHDSAGPAGRFLVADTRFDLAREPAGGYDVEVKAWQQGDSGALLRRAHFSVGWQADTWLRNAADLTDDVHFLLSTDDEEAFARLQPGEQEHYMAAFWRRRDPTPETAFNEAYATFRERVAHANATYTRYGLEKGMFSDMGRVYIRYGPPGEVLREVLPAGDETLSEVIEQLSTTEDRSAWDLHMKGPGSDQRPYEVWIYEGDIPTPPDADPRNSLGNRKRRLVFLFVDEQGLGHYTLRYSTE